MNPEKVERSRLERLTDLPNVGEATARDLRLIGISTPEDLAGRCPFAMYDALCEKTGIRQDPCVLDVFMSITVFMNGGDPRPWWEYTPERKRKIRQRNLPRVESRKSAGKGRSRPSPA